jgi:small subunit ribosomal protein S1
MMHDRSGRDGARATILRIMNEDERIPNDDDPLLDSEEDFASMLEESLEPAVFERGQMVEGTIVSLSRDVAFIDVGGKGEATMDLEELLDDDGDLQVEVGDAVHGVVVSTAGGLRLSHKLARGAVTRQRLADAHESGLPVEGRVEKAIKGGYDVKIGGQRAFCPISQIDTQFTEDPAVHEGKVYTYRITEFRDGRNVVVSRRALLAEQEAEQEAEVRKTIVPDAVLPGRVASVRNYGAFVDLGGGIQGLLHVSEMGWSRVSDPATIVQPGDSIQVKVLAVDEDKGKISLGLKQLQADPWDSAEDTFEVGQVLGGRVTRVAEFGVFVELQPGIEALAHASTFPPTGKRDAWKETIAAGDQVAVELLSFEPERRRIGVAIVDEDSARARRANRGARIVPGARLQGKVDRVESYGVFVFLEPGRVGLVHGEETGFDRGADLRKEFPVGSAIEVMVLEVDGERIRLSRKAVFEADEKAEVRDFTESRREAGQQGLGSLADQLRAAMGKKEGSS